MTEDYRVLMKLSLINDISPQLTFISNQFHVLNKEADSFLIKMKSLKSFSYGVLGTAAVFAAPIVYAITKAAELQKSLIGIQIATHASTQQMNNMRSVIEKSAAPTQFSIGQVANMGKIIATSNTFNAPQLASLLPAYTKFADVQYILKGTSPDKSVLEAVRLAHTAQIYTPAAMTAYLNTLTKASIMSGGDVTELGHALKYSQGTAQTALGISPEQMILVTALANRMGFAGSRGGTNLIDAMIRTVPGVFGSGLLKGKSKEALHNMGFIDSHGHSTIFTHGKFDIMKWMKQLSAYETHEYATHPEAIARQDILVNMQHAFGSIGRRIAVLFSSPVARQQLQVMHEQFLKLPGNEAIQNMYVQHSVSQQYRTALTNFQTVLTEFGYYLLPDVLAALKEINKELSIFIPWMKAHKELISELAKDFLKLTIALAVAGGITLLAASLTALVQPVGLLVFFFAAILKPINDIISAYDYLTNGKKDKASLISEARNYFQDPKNLPIGTNYVEHHSPILAAAHGGSFSNMFYHSGSAGNVVQIHYHYLDGKQISSSTISHMSKSASHAPAHGSSFNSSMGLSYNMLNQGQ
jgi:hypothetical protein